MTPPLDQSASTHLGAPLPRLEDEPLLRGQGSFSDDLSLPGMLHGVFVRSPVAHGVIRALGATAARALPGVAAVLTAADLAALGLRPLPPGLAIPGRDGAGPRRAARMAFPADRVRHVGEALALVVAATPAQARDAAEAVAVEIDPLPAVTGAAAAVAPGAPLVHEIAPGNVALDFHYGDTAAVAAAFAGAAHVVRCELVSQRLVVCAMEPRSALASFDPAGGRYTIRLGTQGVISMRAQIAEAMGVEPARVRVLSGHTGGSFGMKGTIHPEYPALLAAARLLGVPVKWTDARSESFLSDTQGRASAMTGEAAFDAQGRILAVRLAGFGDIGAHATGFCLLPASVNAVKNTASVYATPLLEVSTRLVYTHTPPVGPYRGAGRPEGNFYMERLIDAGARAAGLGADEIRRRNLIRPGQLPFTAASGMRYDAGDFPGLLARALALADWDGFPARRAGSERAGFLRGRGIGQYLEVTAGPSDETGAVRFERDGTLTLISGTHDHGQGHATSFAQLLAGALGLAPASVRLVQGDSDEVRAGGGTGGSRSLMAGGAAVLAAAAAVVERGRALAAEALEAAAEDIVFAEGRFAIAGTDRAIPLAGLVAWSFAHGREGALDVRESTRVEDFAFPNGCHIAEVEIDRETGAVRLARYTAVNDFGTVVNPRIVEGQTHGGVMQGLGQALRERTVFDEAGQLLTGSFMDYALARADDGVAMVVENRPTPALGNPLGAKGCGEAGCAGALPAVINAVIDALGGREITMPASPQKVWAALREG